MTSIVFIVVIVGVLFVAALVVALRHANQTGSTFVRNDSDDGWHFFPMGDGDSNDGCDGDGGGDCGGSD